MPKNPSIPKWHETEEIIPTWEQTSDSKELSKKQEPTEDISKLESFGRGAAQGASFGYADELTALLESLGSQAAHAVTDEYEEKPYEQALKESRSAYHAAQEANPITYGTGQISGAIGSSFIPGVGAIGTAAKGATLGTKIGLGILGGAATGALTAGGTSEKSLTEQPIDLAKDVGEGALSGAAIGAALPIAGQAIKGVGKVTGNLGKKALQAGKEFIEETPTLNIPIEIFKEAKAAEGLTSKLTRPTQQAIAKESVDTLQELVKSKAIAIDDVPQLVDELANPIKNPKLRIEKVTNEVQKRLKNPDISSDEKNDLANLLELLKQSAKVQTKEKLVPAGSVLPGTIEKETEKITSKLSEEKAKLISQIKQLKELQGIRAEELTPELNDQVESAIGKLEQKVSEIDKTPTKLNVPDTNQDVLTALLKQPQITDENKVILGKAAAKALPTDITKIVGERTPLKTIEEQVMTNPELSAVQSRELQAELNKLGELRSVSGETLRKDLLGQAKTGMARGDETAREAVNIANKEFSDIKNILEEKGLGLKETQLSQDVDYMKAMGDVRDNYETMLELSRKAGASEVRPTEANLLAKDRLQQSLNNLKEIEPEIGKIMEEKLLKGAKRHALAEEIAKPTLLGSKDLTGIAGGLMALAYKGARTAGNATRALTNMLPDDLLKISSQASGNTKNLLEKIASTPDRSARNAYIFAAMQRPEFRKDLGVNEEEK